MAGISSQTIIWFTVSSSFIAFFSYTLFKTRNLSLTLRYSSWLTVIAVVIGFVSLTTSQKMQDQRLQAEQDFVPREMNITQLSEDSVYITWKTDKQIVQYIRYWEVDSNLFKTGLDEQPTLSKSLHYVKLTNLIPNKHYFFTIKSKDNEFATYQGKRLEFTLK